MFFLLKDCANNESSNCYLVTSFLHILFFLFLFLFLFLFDISSHVSIFLFISHFFYPSLHSFFYLSTSHPITSLKVSHPQTHSPILCLSLYLSLTLSLSLDLTLPYPTQVKQAVFSGPTTSYAFTRLELLSAKFNLHILLNGTRELNASKSVPHRDFYNVRKVDTHVHHSVRFGSFFVYFFIFLTFFCRLYHFFFFLHSA
jgi:AMP deaminase